MKVFLLIAFICFAPLFSLADNRNPIIDYDVSFFNSSEGSFLELNALTVNARPDQSVTGIYPFHIHNKTVKVNITEGKGIYKITEEGSFLLFISHKKNYKLYHFYITDNTTKKTPIPLWLSILPPLIAILFALIFREVIISIFLGILIGAFIANGMQMELLLISFFNVIDKYIIGAMADSGHISIIVFSLLIGGMVAVISRNGGMAGIVKKLSRYARSAKSAQLITWFLGIAIFFDDYANTLIVGNTMRPVTDKFKISREKLAYIVDSTAAPIAAIAFISTWIGAELGYIQDAISTLGINKNVYAVFFNSLGYSYYPVLSIVFMFLLIYMRRDFGPMFKAEKRARTTGKISGSLKNEDNLSLKALDPVQGISHKWGNGVIPIITVIVVTITGLLFTGYDNNIWDNHDINYFKKLAATIGRSNSYIALLWGSLSGCAIAVILTISQKLMSIGKTITTLIEGLKNMLPAIIILVLAWSLAASTQELHTANFITAIFSDNFSPALLPAVTFALAALIAFATGTSWGTMAILYPLILPTTWTMCQENGLAYQESMDIFYPVVAVVLAGAVFGDHCSPISDTTILSSLASNCNHIEHVRTQLPYAIVVASISLLLLIIPVFIQLHWSISFILGIIIIWLLIKFIGKHIKE